MRTASFLFLVLCGTACAVDHPQLGTGTDTGLADQGALEDAPAPDSAPDVDVPDTRPTLDTGPLFDGGPDGGDAAIVDAGPDAADAGPVASDAGPDASDAGPDASDAGCSFAPHCDGNTLVVCTAGTPDRLPCADATCELLDGAGCYDFDPSNVDATAYVPSGTGLAVLSGETYWDTSDCNLIPGYRGSHSTDTLCVLSFDAVRFEGTHHVTGDRPLLVLAAGTLEITGTFHADGDGILPGPGGGFGGAGAMSASPAPQGGQRGTAEGDYAHGGGGGGAGGASGGAGGTGGAAVGGAGGMAHDLGYFLAPLRGGGGGGAARGRGGNGGAGGGVLQFSARGELRFSGIINIAGGAGLPGRAADSPAHGGDGGGGGGGGGGGSLLLESGTQVVLGGTVYAAGGAGAGSASCSRDGQPGGEERDDDNVLGGAESVCVSVDRAVLKSVVTITMGGEPISRRTAVTAEQPAMA